VQSEKDLWEQKYEQKRKSFKETEQRLNRENNDLQKKLCLLQESYQRLDMEKRRQDSEYEEKIADYE
jgi:DNA repair exonuclease SbcCD ATPase subunit